MKGTGLETSAVLSRDWSLKCKRGETPGTNKSIDDDKNYKPAQHQSTTSSKCGLNNDVCSAQCSGKRKKGDDGSEPKEKRECGRAAKIEDEYTPAGRARKEKLAKLRARQKERLAKRNAPGSSALRQEQCMLESIAQLPRFHIQNDSDKYMPSAPRSLNMKKGKGPAEHPWKSAASFYNRQEKMVRELPLGGNLLPGYLFCGANMPTTSTDLYPKLSLGSRVAQPYNTAPGLPMLPLLPNPRFSLDPFKYSPARQEMPPGLGSSQVTSSFSLFPEKHSNVLEDIILRAGAGSSNMLKNMKVEIWSEDELDCLWVGTRRHGHGNWDAMLQDPRLKFSRFKTAKDLSARWEEEQVRYLTNQDFPY